MDVGTAQADPGEWATGHLSVTGLPTGGEERLPLVLCNGDQDGPTCWVTAGVHGDESTGIAAAQDVADLLDPADVAGAVVVVPVVNPAGLRRNARTSYYHGDDPNRYFPDDGGRDSTADADPVLPRKVQERIDRRVYDAVMATEPAGLLDLHTAQINSRPFAIRDRTLYGEDRDEAAAGDLASNLEAFLEATGLPIVTEYPAAEYTERGLQRSFTGAVYNDGGVPASTIELGTHGVVDESMRALGVSAVCRVLVHLGILGSVPRGVAAFAPVVDDPVDYRVRRAAHPRTPEAGLVRHRVEPGDVIESGEVVAEIVSPTGATQTAVESEHDGYVIARNEGLARYENDPVCSLAVRDEADLVVPREDD